MKTLALVLGNNDYHDSAKLINAVNDAKEIADVFKRLGYEVILRINQKTQDYEEILENIKKIHALCAEYRKDMPTEMKLIYDVKKNSLKADYCYENLWTDSETKLGLHIYEEWFEEVKKKEEG